MKVTLETLESDLSVPDGRQMTDCDDVIFCSLRVLLRNQKQTY